MKYRTLGRTGLSVSEIGFGTEHVVQHPQKAADEVVAKAIDRGVNYFDFFWPQGDYRDTMAKALAGRRESIHLAGHLGVITQDGQYAKSRSIDSCRENFHDFLRRFSTDYVDVLMLHYVDKPSDLNTVLYGEFMEMAQELKKQGKARYFGLSTHEADIGKKSIESGLVDVIMFSMNPAFDVLGHISSENTEEKAAKRMAELGDEGAGGMFRKRKEFYHMCVREDIGLAAMKPFAGGWLLSPNKLKHSPTAVQCVHFLLNQPCVSTIVPGMQTLDELDDVLRYYQASDKEKDYADIVKDNDWDLKGSCMYCNHCFPCPSRIHIGETLKILDNAAAGMTDALKEEYERLEVTAEECIECGECMKRCPFGVPVIQRMQEAVEVFGK